ncbi:MAG: hypothetical protein CSA23_03130 [Deltaproteobacteria bacterium]|nr:MAG: hypothetical protein CSA23_03130 [Deltaproteobacteria bacterium]
MAGCGIKGPPVPPDRRLRLPAVALDYRVAGTQVILTWRLPEKRDTPLAKEMIYDIYRSRTHVSEPVCATCPLVFEKVAGVPHRDTGDGPMMTSQALDPGYRYAFKVRTTARGVKGVDSNTVRFIFSPGKQTLTTEAP